MNMPKLQLPKQPTKLPVKSPVESLVHDMLNTMACIDFRMWVKYTKRANRLGLK